MPTITINNLSTMQRNTAVGTIPPAGTLTVDVDSVKLEKMADELTTLSAAGAISYSLADDASQDNQLEKAALDLSNIPAKTITKAMCKVFISTEQTGNGSSQNIAHGLGVAPSVVFVAATNTGAAYTVTEGAHDATNVKVTATTGAKYKVLAWV